MIHLLAYYGSRISEHMTKTPEGFLICHNVPIARTGRQEYLRSEIGLTGDSLVMVTRDEDEVFSKKAIASFEGKPVTLEHPPCAVMPENYNMYMKGHCQNVHRGVGENSDLLMADLFINDAELIRLIDNGLREISCGYECDYSEDGDGRFYQCGIRGNHVAVVEEGRAGSRVSIKDSFAEVKRKNERNDYMSNTPSVLARFFSGWAKDRAPEEVACAIDELIEGGEDLNENGFVEAEEMAPAPKAPAGDALENSGDVIALLQQILDKLNGGATATDANPEAPIDNLIGELGEGGDKETCDADESCTVPEDEDEFARDEDIPDMQEEEEPCMDSDCNLTKKDMGWNPCEKTTKDSASTIAALKALKPYLAKLPTSDRKAAAEAATKAVRKARGMKANPTMDGYSNVFNATMKNTKKKTVKDDSEIGRSIMAKYNPHYNK